MAADTFVCRHCSVKKPLTAFAVVPPNGRRRVCKACRNLPWRERRNPHLRQSPLWRYPSVSPPAATSPTLVDLAWAAGIYEGEGSVAYSSGVRVNVTQKDPWILYRLQALFGGHVRQDEKREHTIWRWYAYGRRAMGVLLTLYTWLSPRRRTRVRWALGHAC